MRAVKTTHKVANKRKYDQIVGEMGIESTHDNHLVLKNRQLGFLAMIIIACLKQESKSVDKEVSYW